MSRPEAPAIPGIVDGAAIAATAGWIARVQEPSGAIPWFPRGQVDVWDHVESAMALTAAGRWAEARGAFEWLRRTQRADGSWPLRQRRGRVEDGGADANHCAYVAVGTLHHLLITGDESFAHHVWPTVRRALDFAVGLQT
ncbi:MAG: prenyltransferase, partial [Actinomycetota bacterium]